MKERFLGVFHPRHRTETRDFWALDDVSLTIGAGEAVGLVGRNGLGKSTLLKLIAGVHCPTSGRVLVRRDARIGSLIQLRGGDSRDVPARVRPEPRPARVRWRRPYAGSPHR